MSTARIGLPADGLTLQNTSGRPGPPDVLAVEVHNGSLVATTEVHDLRFDDLATWFAGLSADWRGWTGRRDWASLEGDLELSATHGRSRVLLGVRVASRIHGWTVTTQISLQAGEQLTRTVEEVSALVAGEPA